MGNSLPSPSTPDKPSRRPFAPWNKRSLGNLVNQQKKTSPLQKLILLRDWQRVLCRVQLYPEELQQYFKFKVGDNVQLKVLPLHLVSALDPPLAVIEFFLQSYNDAAALPVRPAKQRRKSSPPHRNEDTVSKSNSSRGTWKNIRPKGWYQNRRGAFPVILETDNCFEDAPQSPLLSSTPSGTPSSFVTAAQSHVKMSCMDNDENQSGESSSISSQQSFPNKNVILHLSSSGALQPIPVRTVDKDNRDSESTTIFCIRWDLQPVQEHVIRRGTLLALHIACFYSASTSVLRAIANANPAAALCDVVGMLPIHWVAAGWTLPPLLPPPGSLLPSIPKPSPLECLSILKDTVPDSVRIRSGNHSKTPEEYVHECMEESDLKDACMRLLQNVDDDSLDGSIFFSSSDTSSGPSPDRPDSVCCLGTMMAERDWEGILVAVEDDPEIASRWIFGMDRIGTTVVVWKRLPIHLACAYGAPVGLVSILLNAYPDGGMAADPVNGFTPLHFLCQTDAPPTVIRLLLNKCPEATRKVNFEGQTSLHVAILSEGSYSLVETLLEDDPVPVSMPDAEGLTPLDHAKRIYGDKSVVLELITMIHRFMNKSITS